MKSATVIALQIVRTNAQERERFLNNLLRKNGARIFRTVTSIVEPGTQLFSDLMNGEVQQAFLLGANKALDRFQETDDGRGKNDYAGFCSWCGIKNVLDAIRNTMGRFPRRCHRIHEVPVGNFMLPDMTPKWRANAIRNAEGFFSRHQVPTARDPIEDLLAYDMIATFLPQLEPRDRIVAELMIAGYGPAQRNNDLNETNRGRRQNYLRELKMATGYSEPKLRESINRLREAAAKHFNYVPRQ